MRIQKKLSVLLIAIFLIFSMSMTTYAHEVPDDSKKGSVSVTMTYDGNAVSGGKMILYRVGEIYEDDGNYSFTLTEDFAKSGVSLDDLSSTSLAKTLAAYSSEHKLTGTEVEIDNNGKATAENLTLGLYLIVQNEAAKGYEAVDPFLVTVPMNEDGSYIYHVDATPKLSILKKTPSTTETPTSPPVDSKLPQTGQLNWPVSVLAVLGMGLFLLGWLLCFGKKEASYEA